MRVALWELWDLVVTVCESCGAWELQCVLECVGLHCGTVTMLPYTYVIGLLAFLAFSTFSAFIAFFEN